jgi:hypothetical protein
MYKLRGPSTAGAVCASWSKVASLEMWVSTRKLGRAFVDVLHKAKKLQSGEQVAFEFQGFMDSERLRMGESRFPLKKVVFTVTNSSFQVERFAGFLKPSYVKECEAILTEAGLLTQDGFPTEKLTHESMLDGSALRPLIEDEEQRRLAFNGFLAAIKASVTIEVVDGDTLLFRGSRYDFWKLANDAEFALNITKDYRENTFYTYYVDAGPEDISQFSFVGPADVERNAGSVWAGTFYFCFIAEPDCIDDVGPKDLTMSSP